MNKKAYSNNVAFYTFLTAYSICLIYLCGRLNVWEDEAYTLHTTSNNLSTVVRLAYNFEGQSPLYFILLSFWRLINTSIFFARFFSLICLGVSACFFHKIIRVIARESICKWMTVIFLLNPFAVWAGLEIRLYALALLLSTISIYYFLLFYIEEKNKYLYAFLITSLIGLYTQYFFVLEIAALTAIILIFKGWKSFFNLSIYLIVLVILFIPNLFFIHQQVSMLQSHKEEYDTATRMLDIYYAIQEIPLSIPLVPENLKHRSIIVLIFALLLLFAYFKTYKNRTTVFYFKKINAVIFSILILIILYVILFLATGIIFQTRYMAIVFPLFMLLFTLFKTSSSLYNNIIYAAISIYYIWLLILNYKNPIKNYDFIATGKFIEKIEKPGEPILFYGKSLLPPFSYYYHGKNNLVPIPALVYNQNYYDDNINDTTVFKNEINKINFPSHSYLLITDNAEDYKYNTSINEQLVNKCLNNNFITTFDSTFTGQNKNHVLRIRRLQIK